MKFKNIVLALSLTFTFSNADYTAKIPLEVQLGGNLPDDSIIINNGGSNNGGNPTNPGNANCKFDVENSDSYWYEESGVPVDIFWDGVYIDPTNTDFTKGALMEDYGADKAYEICYNLIPDGTENLPEGDNDTENGFVYKGTFNVGSYDSGWDTYYGYHPEYGGWQNDPYLDSGSLVPKTSFIEDPSDEDKGIYSIVWHEFSSDGHNNFFLQITAGSKYVLKTITVNGIKFNLTRDSENHNLYTVESSYGWPYARNSYNITITADVLE